MDRWIIPQVVDLMTGEISFSGGYEPHAIKGDNLSIEWDVEVRKNGSAANLTGCSCMVYGNRQDKATCIAVGTISDNHVTVQIPQQFLALNGKVQCLMTLTNGTDGTAITISELNLNVCQGPYDAIIDPGETLPNISQGLVAIQELADYVLDSAAVANVVNCVKTADNTYRVTYADGTVYNFTAVDSVITFIT